MNEIELRSLTFTEDGEKDDNLIVQGYIKSESFSHVLGKGIENQWKEIIKPGVFQNAIDKAFANCQHIDFLLDHDRRQILATTQNGSLKLDEDEVGLYFEAKIAKTTWGNDAYTLIKEGIISGLSFGMKVIRDEWELVDYDGYEMPIRTIFEIELYEVSALRTPAYPETLVQTRGIEIKEIEIPQEIQEKRNLEGGNTMGEQEVTPEMIYNGLTLIATKLDTIIDKIDLVDRERAIDGVQEAKEVIAKVETIVSDLAEDKKVEQAEEVVEGEKDFEPEEKTEDEKIEEKAKDDEDVKPDETEDEPEGAELEKEVDEKVSEEDIEKTDVITEEEAEEDVETEEKDDEKEKNKKKINEYRSIFEELKMEVTTIE